MRLTSDYLYQSDASRPVLQHRTVSMPCTHPFFFSSASMARLTPDRFGKQQSIQEGRRALEGAFAWNVAAGGYAELESGVFGDGKARSTPLVGFP